MKEKIKNILKFEGFGDVEKIVSLIVILLAFILTLYIYFANVFNV